MSESAYQALFVFLKSFTDIPSADEEIIRENTVVRQIRDGEVLLPEGQLVRELYFISDGVLKILTLNTKGKEVALFFLKENHFCTLLNSFNNNLPATETIAAACDGEVIVFTQGRLQKLYTRLPYLKDVINNATRQTLLDKVRIRNTYLGEDASTRYQKFLLQQPTIVLRVSLSDVASYLGITLQSLSRIRKNML